MMEWSENGKDRKVPNVTITVGWVLALLALLVVVVLLIIGQMGWPIGAVLLLLALSRLVP